VKANAAFLRAPSSRAWPARALPLTAKTNAARLFMTLGARDRAQLVVTACETALVTRAREADASCRQGARQSGCREETCIGERRDVLDLVAAEVEDLD
jgi:hypothetical protein